MAGVGPAPKPDDQRRRRNTPASGNERELVRDEVQRGPELPDHMAWDERTVEWYETWRVAPQAQVFEVTDWQRLHLLAYLVNDYFLAPDKGLLAEIRLNEERMGALWTDRQRARMRIIAPQLVTEQQPGMAGVVDARSRFANR
jgi:hypothetical protein